MYDTRERRSAEPVGLRLMSFLAAHGREILDREKDNTASVHLYGAGAYWVAFERSACQMCRLFPQSETAVFRFREFPFPVVMASVEDDRLREYVRRHILRSPNTQSSPFRSSHSTNTDAGTGRRSGNTDRESFEMYNHWPWIHYIW